MAMGKSQFISWLNSVYRDVLDRNADSSGKNTYWNLYKSGMKTGQIQGAIAGSEEAQMRSGGGSGGGAGGYIPGGGMQAPVGGQYTPGQYDPHKGGGQQGSPNVEGPSGKAPIGILGGGVVGMLGGLLNSGKHDKGFAYKDFDQGKSQHAEAKYAKEMIAEWRQNNLGQSLSAAAASALRTQARLRALADQGYTLNAWNHLVPGSNPVIGDRPENVIKRMEELDSYDYKTPEYTPPSHPGGEQMSPFGIGGFRQDYSSMWPQPQPIDIPEAYQIPGSPYEEKYRGIYETATGRESELFEQAKGYAGMLPTDEDRQQAQSYLAPTVQRRQVELDKRLQTMDDKAARARMTGSPAYQARRQEAVAAHENENEALYQNTLGSLVQQRQANISSLLGYSGGRQMQGLGAAADLESQQRMGQAELEEATRRYGLAEQSDLRNIMNQRYSALTGQQFQGDQAALARELQKYGIDIDSELKRYGYDIQKYGLDLQKQLGLKKLEFGASESEKNRQWQDYWKNREFDLASKLGGQQKDSNMWGTLGTIGGTILGNMIAPGIGGTIGGTIGGGLGNLGGSSNIGGGDQLGYFPSIGGSGYWGGSNYGRAHNANLLGYTQGGTSANV